MKYYISAQPYNRVIGGVKVLYALADLLALHKQEVYIGDQIKNPDPNSIAIYPEIQFGNPFGSKTVVRYILNERQITAGTNDYNDGNDILLAFSSRLKPTPDAMTLTVLIADLDVFKDRGLPREGICFRGGRFGEEVKVKGVEIDNVYPASTEEMADLLNRKEMFYAYACTGIIQEAVLCGCIAVCMPSAHYTYNILERELGSYGIAWGENEIQVAKRTLPQARERYIQCKEETHKQVEAFIEKSQEIANKK